MFPLPVGAWLNNYGTILKSGGTNFSSFRGQHAYTNYGLIDVPDWAAGIPFWPDLAAAAINVARNTILRFAPAMTLNLGPNHKFTGEGPVRLWGFDTLFSSTAPWMAR